MFNHLSLCSDPTYRTLESGLSFTEAIASEGKWQADYAANGWLALHKAKAGSLGSIKVRKWTKEAVLADAKRFATKQAWIDGSQGSYRAAKAEGWYDEASAHMPKRALGVGLGIAKSPEAREKMRQAKLGKAQSPEYVAARLNATRAALAVRSAIVIQRLKDDPALFTTPMPELEARHDMSRPTLTKYMRIIRTEQDAAKPAEKVTQIADTMLDQ